MHSENALDVLRDGNYLAHLEILVGNEWGAKFVTDVRTQLRWGSLFNKFVKSVGILNLFFNCDHYSIFLRTR